MSSVAESCLLDKNGPRVATEIECLGKEQCIRKSTRDPGSGMMDRNDLSLLHTRIRDNHFSTIVLKVKDHLLADINSNVFDSIVDALWNNKVCQGLYIQNLSRAIGDEQLKNLLELLKKKKIWCLNIGESYEVSATGWKLFCDTLPQTNVTHLYVSEHTIPIELKNMMRHHIRENRKKHKLHCAFKNVSVIERCTHMWWNPINGVKELKPPPPPVEEPEEVEEEPAARILPTLTAAHTAYWQEGVGEGGDKPWKFKCMCGETCSSYENFRYHPTGRMYECSNPACCLWSHVSCVLGPNITDAELAKMKDLLCGACKAKSRRLSKYLGVSISELNAPPAPEPPVGSKGKKGGAKSASTGTGRGRPEEGEEEEADKTPWTFKCKCGEVCSSYENAMYHPAGQWFECSQCSVWSHVLCLLGNVSPEKVAEMKEVLCFSCTSKNRRNRSSRGGTLQAALPVVAGVVAAPPALAAVVDELPAELSPVDNVSTIADVAKPVADVSLDRRNSLVEPSSSLLTGHCATSEPEATEILALTPVSDLKTTELPSNFEGLVTLQQNDSSTSVPAVKLSDSELVKRKASF